MRIFDRTLTRKDQNHLKNILTIKQPRNAMHIFWEHAMKSVFAFSGTFALLFFGPMFLAAGSSDGQGVDDATADTTLNFIGYMLEHPAVEVSICLFVVLVYNITIAVKNARRNYLVIIDVNDGHVQLGLTNSYYKTVEQIEIPINNLEYQIIKKSSELSGKTSRVKFFNNRTGSLIAIIQMDYIIWEAQVKDIKKALVKLDELGVKRGKTQESSFSIIGKLFGE